MLLCVLLCVRAFVCACRALLDLPPVEFQAARTLLHGSRCVFVGSGFAEAPKVAFQVCTRVRICARMCMHTCVCMCVRACAALCLRVRVASVCVPAFLQDAC